MMNKSPVITNRNSCRSCGHVELKPFLHLPQMPFTDDFIQQNRFGKEFKSDIDVFVCTHCLVAQTLHDVDVSEYYEDYQYSVGGTQTASKFMRLVAENLRSKYYPEVQGRKVLEIGSGDGEQLLAFKETGCQVLGWEPSSVLCQVARHKGISSIQGLFSAESLDCLPDDFREIDVIMLSYTFDHLPEPRAFLAAAHSILNKHHGLLVVEVHNLEKIIERSEYCLFEHEHSIYLTEASARYLCSLEQLTIIDYDLIPEYERRANSLIFVATPKGSNFELGAVLPSTSIQFSTLEYYDQIAETIYQGVSNLEAFVDHVTVGNTRKLAGYGGGGRGVMTLAAMNNACKIEYLVDKKPKGIGLLTPKSGVPLVGIDKLISDPVDEILVFSFGYMAEIQAELRKLGYSGSQLHSLLDILAGRF
jgi:ubiquinone/menaquinone biosynthesis C-methylase UbiE